jgi:hypothetical protein
VGRNGKPAFRVPSYRFKSPAGAAVRPRARWATARWANGLAVTSQHEHQVAVPTVAVRERRERGDGIVRSPAARVATYEQAGWFGLRSQPPAPLIQLVLHLLLISRSSMNCNCFTCFTLWLVAPHTPWPPLLYTAHTPYQYKYILHYVFLFICKPHVASLLLYNLICGST